MIYKYTQSTIGLQELWETIKKDGELVILTVQFPDSGDEYKFAAYAELCPNPYLMFKPMGKNDIFC